DPDAEGVLFVVDGEIALTLDGKTHEMTPGGYAYLPPAAKWTLRNAGTARARFHWVRKAYEKVDGIDTPEAFVTNEADHEPFAMPDTDGAWATTRFVEP